MIHLSVIFVNVAQRIEGFETLQLLLPVEDRNN